MFKNLFFGYLPLKYKLVLRFVFCFKWFFWLLFGFLPVIGLYKMPFITDIYTFNDYDKIIFSVIWITIFVLIPLLLLQLASWIIKFFYDDESFRKEYW